MSTESRLYVVFYSLHFHSFEPQFFCRSSSCIFFIFLSSIRRIFFQIRELKERRPNHEYLMYILYILPNMAIGHSLLRQFTVVTFNSSFVLNLSHAFLCPDYIFFIHGNKNIYFLNIAPFF